VDASVRRPVSRKKLIPCQTVLQALRRARSLVRPDASFCDSGGGRAEPSAVADADAAAATVADVAAAPDL